MITKEITNFSLRAIADSGQCFRWKEWGGGYRIIAMGKILHVRQVPGTDRLEMDCTEEDFQNVWKAYFDWDTDYRAIIQSIPDEDDYLLSAAAYGQGIRILRQEPWETLATFILSQRKNIPAIKQAVEKLCAAAGEKIGEDGGEAVYAFPTPEAILCLPPEELQGCGLGYRGPYIRNTALAVCEGRCDLAALSDLDDNALYQALCGLYGVGRKIALCTMLFGFHRMNAFPMDVWMNRVWENRYPGGIPVDRYTPWAGVMQQYMFAYERHLALETPL